MNYNYTRTLLALLLLCCGFGLNAQQQANGPVNLQLRVDNLWRGRYEDLIDNTEERSKIWFRDAANLDGNDWVGGQCFQYIGPSGSGGFPFWSGPFNQVLFNQTYGANVPNFFQIQLEGWEEDSGGDCDYNGPCSICLDPDDDHCSPTQISGDINFRNVGAPCTWNSIDVFGNGGSCSFYGVRTGVYYTPAVPTITGTTTGCGSVTVTATGATFGGSYKWYTTPSGGSPIFNGSAYTITTPGTTTVYCEIDNGCPSLARRAVTVTVNTLDNATFSYPATSLCVNGSNAVATISGVTGGSFTSSPAGLSLNGANGLINAAGSAPGNYTVTYTTTGACPNSASVPVTVNAADNPAFSYPSSSYCTNATNPVPVISGLNGGNFSSTSGISLNPANGLIDLAASTPAQYTVTYTTAGACPANASQVITINPAQSAAFTYPLVSVCQEDPTPFLATITGDLGGSFNATPAGLVLDPNTGLVDLINSTAGQTYIISYTNAGPCAATQNVQVNVIDNPAPPVVVPPAPICDGQPIPQLTAGGLGGQIDWFNAPTAGQLIVSNSSSFTPVILSGPGTYSYFAQENDPNGCASQRTQVDVIINANPAPAVANPVAPICIGSPIPQLSVSGNSVNFNWYDAPFAGTLLQPNNASYTPTITNPGTYTYYVQTTSLASCSSTIRVPVTLVVNALPLVDLATTDNGLCANDVAVPLFGFPQGGSITPAPGVVGSTFDPAAGLIGANNLTYTYTDGNGCTNTNVETVTVFAVPQPTITTNTSSVICTGGSVTLDAGSGFANYVWAPNGQTSQTITVNTDDVYTVTVTSTDGCVGQATNTITVVTAPDTLDAGPAQGFVSTFCQGQPVNTVLDAGAGYASYAWAPGGASSQTINVNSPGTYTVTVTDNVGCQFTQSIAVGFSNVSANIVANGPTTFCLGDSVLLDAGAGYIHLWNSGSTTQLIEVTQTGNYSVVVEDEFGCQATDNIQVTVQDPATAEFDYAQDANSLTVSFVDFSDNATSYSWTFQSGNPATSTLQNPVVVYPDNGEYVVTLTTTNTCGTTSVTDTVFVKSPVGINDIFTDGFKLFPNPTNGLLQLQFSTTNNQTIGISLFNTLGQQIWTESTTVDGAFNKAYDLSALADGVYMLQLTTTNGINTQRVIVRK